MRRNVAAFLLLTLLSLLFVAPRYAPSVERQVATASSPREARLELRAVERVSPAPRAQPEIAIGLAQLPGRLRAKALESVRRIAPKKPHQWLADERTLIRRSSPRRAPPAPDPAHHFEPSSS